jgi:hypothetical protein
MNFFKGKLYHLCKCGFGSNFVSKKEGCNSTCKEVYRRGDIDGSLFPIPRCLLQKEEDRDNGSPNKPCSPLVGVGPIGVRSNESRYGWTCYRTEVEAPMEYRECSA